MNLSSKMMMRSAFAELKREERWNESMKFRKSDAFLSRLLHRAKHFEAVNLQTTAQEPDLSDSVTLELQELIEGLRRMSVEPSTHICDEEEEFVKRIRGLDFAPTPKGKFKPRSNAHFPFADITALNADGLLNRNGSPINIGMQSKPSAQRNACNTADTIDRRAVNMAAARELKLSGPQRPQQHVGGELSIHQFTCDARPIEIAHHRPRCNIITKSSRQPNVKTRNAIKGAVVGKSMQTDAG